MSDAAAQRIQDGLAAADAALRLGAIDAMHAALVATLDALADIAAQGLVARRDARQPPWDAAAAERLVWQLLARLKQEGCAVFPYAGTLLGLERDGALLPGDKDIDFGVWLEDFALAGRLLQALGLARATDTPPFDNIATYIESGSGNSVDLFGLRRDPLTGAVECGAWLYGRPASFQRVVRFPAFGLRPRAGAAGEVWWPDPPAVLLDAMYGPWRERDAEWDTLVSNRALVEVNLSWRAWACKRLATRWLQGDAAATRRLLAQIEARDPGRPEYARWRHALEAAPAAGAKAERAT